MENITMTIDATHMSRVRSVCPEAGQQLLMGSRGWVAEFNGTFVPASVAVRGDVDARVDGQAPVGYIGGFDATPSTSTKDLAFRPFGEPPV